MKRFFRLLSLLLALAPLCATLFGLVACGEKQPVFTPQPGVSYTQALDAMNRQVMTGLSREIPDISWWGAVGGRIVLAGCGAADADSGERPWLLADVDPEGENYASMSLTLPAVGDDLPGLRAALENPDTAHDLAAGYDLAWRNIAAVLEDSAQQVYLLVEDLLMHYGQEAGATTATASERALTLCNLSADGALQPLARLQLPAEYALLPSVAETTLLDAGGGLWLTADDLNGQAALLRFSLTDGSLLAALPLPAGSAFSTDCLAQLSDGRLLVLTATAGGAGRSCLAVEDPMGAAPGWSDQPPALPQQLAEGGFVLAFLPQTADAGLLLRSDSGIWRWDVAQGTAGEELTWDGYGIDRLALAAVFAIDGGRYLAVTRPQDGSDWNALATPQDLFGEDWTLTGFPSDQASGRGSAIVPRLQFGISSTCEDPEGAWAFLRLFLLPQFQQKLSVETGYEGFPLRQDALQRAAERPHAGYSQLAAIGEMVAIPLSGQTVDRLLDLIGELDTLWNAEPDLFAIVAEEAEAYYNGQRTAEETAAIIQNRVQTYLDEQG